MTAAASTGSPAFDQRIQGTFPIRLGASVLDSTKSARWTTVRYNKKPTPKSSADGDAESRIYAGSGPGESRLDLRDEEGVYKYLGKHEGDPESYVLVFRSADGGDKELVLERVSEQHGFNLTSTPSEHDAAELALKYPHLPDEDSTADDENLFGDDDADAEPDASNPFDWRHFLKSETETADSGLSASPPAVKPVPGAAGSRLAAKRAEVAAAAKKRKTSTKKAMAKRVKAGEDPPVTSIPSNVDASKPRAGRDLPTLRIDRKASTHRNSFDDSGELILEDDTPVVEKPRPSMALALAGQLGSGPISLRSAAGSPASRIMSEDATGSPEEYTFDLGGSSPEPEVDDRHLDEANSPAGLEIVEDDTNEADADVEDLELPSPAQHHPARGRPDVARPAPATDELVVEEDDDDLDLEGQLAEAFDDDDAGAQDASHAAGVESEESEESEEE